MTQKLNRPAQYKLQQHIKTWHGDGYHATCQTCIDLKRNADREHHQAIAQS